MIFTRVKSTNRGWEWHQEVDWWVSLVALVKHQRMQRSGLPSRLVRPQLTGEMYGSWSCERIHHHHIAQAIVSGTRERSLQQPLTSCLLYHPQVLLSLHQTYKQRQQSFSKHDLMTSVWSGWQDSWLQNCLWDGNKMQSTLVEAGDEEAPVESRTYWDWSTSYYTARTRPSNMVVLTLLTVESRWLLNLT